MISNVNHVVTVDDLFIRRDLFDGKYKPDQDVHDKLMENLHKYGTFWDMEDDEKNVQKIKEEL